ncbi:DUF4129 domain-containing protein [Streptomyces sp. NPDC050145]|uniref:DUF4129 domain-containing protein n=1 Tax=Streptomyces sp. NPDC050145 TaxID=3365602 RepID=UPI00378C47F1
MRTGRHGALLLGLGTVVVLAGAASALHPTYGILHSGRGLFGRTGLLALGIIVAWVVVCSFALERVRERVGADRRDLPPREERLRRLVGLFLRFAPVALGLAALALHRFGRTNRSADEVVPGPTVPHIPGESRTASPTPPASPPSPGHSSALPLTFLLTMLGTAALVVLIVYVLRRLRASGPVPPPLPAPAADADRELLLTAVGSGRRALAEGDDARAAVIACYAAMEEALSASGVGRRASDSPADLLARATGAGLLTGPSAHRLAALFREARYSSHPMDDTRRAAAVAALEEIAAVLGERAAAP